MHKDQPPGIFDFPHRSIAHGIGVGLLVGVLLGAAAHLGLLILRADRPGLEPRRAGTQAAQDQMAKHKRPTDPTPTLPPAVDY